MAASAAFQDFVRDLLVGLGPLSIKRMFGGAGIFCGDAMIGLIADDTLYLKTDERLAEAYEAAGSEPFVYEAKGKTTVLSYWRLPDSAMDDPEEALGWARRSLVPAEAAAAKKRRSATG
ncbi:MAG: TfoX/Sxy family protein [Pseudomonadota bacterium]